MLDWHGRAMTGATIPRCESTASAPGRTSRAPQRAHREHDIAVHEHHVCGALCQRAAYPEIHAGRKSGVPARAQKCDLVEHFT